MASIKKIFSILTMVVLIFLGIFVLGLVIMDHFGEDTQNGYSLDHIHYDVKLLDNGDARVEEERSYTITNKTFSRGYMGMEEGVYDVVVLEDGIPYTKLDRVDQARPAGNYVTLDNPWGTHLEWYYEPDGGEVRDFAIQYKTKGAVTLYNDTAVYFQKLLSERNETKIGLITASIELYQDAHQENTMIWGHGPAHGSLHYDPTQENVVNMEIKNVLPGNFVEVRALLDPYLAGQSMYTENINVKDQIIEEETLAAQEANRDRLISTFSIIIATLVALLLLFLTVFLKIKNKEHFKRFVPEITPEYYREIPEALSPALLDRLFNFYTGREAVGRKISATIMDLIYKNIIEIHKENGGRKPQVYLRLNQENYEKEEIKPYENAVTEFLFNEVSVDGNNISLDELKGYCNKKKNAFTANKMITSFKDGLNNEWNNYGYVETEKNKVPKSIKVLKIISLLVGIGGLFLLLRGPSVLSSAALIIFAGGSISFFISLIISGKRIMLTQEGENRLALWQGFKNFLTEFTLFEEKDMPEIFMWQRYLVYATVFGVANKVLENLKIRYPQLNEPQYFQQNMGYAYAISQGSSNIDFNLDDFSNNLEEAFSNVENIVAQTRSDTLRGGNSGGGGGFSSGGSSGGSGAGGTTGGGMD